MSSVTTTNQKPLTLRDRINSDSVRNEIARQLPKHMTAERMARVTLTALTRIPKLAECTPESFLRCVMDLSQWGLEPDGRRAHLIPFENRRAGTVECQLIIDYKGIVELLYRSGNVTALHADVVYEGDLFGYSLGQIKNHTPWFLLPKSARDEERGKPIAAYCIATMRDGTEKHEVMSYDEIESIRKRSRAGNSGPWVTDWNEMAKKTVFRRCSKWLPWSAEIRDAIENDDDVIETTAVATAPKAAATLDSLILPPKEEPQAEPVCEPVAEGEYTEATPSEPEADPTFRFEMMINDSQGIAELENIEAKVKAALSTGELNAAQAGTIAGWIAEKKAKPKRK